MDDYPNSDKLIEWIQLREKARVEGASGDPNIDNWRYCNVKRQDDKVTKFILDWLAKNQDSKMLVPNAIMARLFNNPNTLTYIGFLQRWDPQWIRAAVNILMKHGERVFNPAYIVSTNGRKMDKVDYLLTEVLPYPFENPIGLKSPELDTMWYQLTALNGIGSFIGAQVIADLKFMDEWYHKAPDWWTFVAPGPGSMRGMNRLRGLAPDYMKYNQKSFSLFIQPVRSIIKVGTGLELCAQDTQNCLCEFDKYMRLVTGEGRPKQTYKRT